MNREINKKSKLTKENKNIISGLKKINKDKKLFEKKKNF